MNFAILCLIIICIAEYRYHHVSAQFQISNQSPAEINFLGYQLSSKQWHDVNETLSCWIDRGSWEFNASHVIVDDFPAFAPCGQYRDYKSRHCCNWILDGNMTRYYWQESSSCHHMKLSSISSTTDLSLKTYDGHQMCDMMKDKGNIMFVGDSVSIASWFSWRTLWHRNMGSSCSNAANSINSCYNLHMYEARNDRLSIDRDHDYVNDTENFHEHTWKERLIPLNVTLLILNRGSHYEPDIKLISDVNHTLHFLTTYHKNISIIWRNTPHGMLNYHFNFFAAPLKTPSYVPHESFHYFEFYHQNMLVRELLAQYYPQVLYLDAYTPTVLRADSRPDPLHICPVGGHTETWFILIYNALLLIKELAKLNNK